MEDFALGLVEGLDFEERLCKQFNFYIVHVLILIIFINYLKVYS